MSAARSRNRVKTDRPPAPDMKLLRGGSDRKGRVDPHAFDNFSRALAVGIGRRPALKLLASGIVGGLLGSAAKDATSALADVQTGASAAVSCPQFGRCSTCNV